MLASSESSMNVKLNNADNTHGTTAISKPLLLFWYKQTKTKPEDWCYYD